MKILIMGAGRIGASVAESLVSEANDITVIDLDADKIAYLQSRFDLRGIVGDATSPAVLKEAGAEDTDMLLAVSSRDESNLVVCLLAARLFNIPTRIARVRNSELRNFPRILKEEGFETTAVIWPEQALTDYLIKLIDIPEALQVQEFGEGAANLIAVKAEAGSPMIGGTANELQAHIPKARAKIVAIFRNGRPLELTDRTLIAPNDEVVFICTPEHARLVTTQLRRRQEPARRLILAGGAVTTKELVESICKKGVLRNPIPDTICVLEPDPIQAERLSRELKSHAIVLEGDFDDEDMLISAGVEMCDLFISLSDDDENNILSGLLAKKLGAKRTIALVNRKVYGELIEGSKIDVTVSQTQAALDELIQFVRKGDITAAYTLRHGIAEAMEIVAHGDKHSSKVVGRTVAHIPLPPGCSVAAVLRGCGEEAEILTADATLEIQSEDHVIVFVPSRRLIPKVERIFTVNIGFF